MITATINPSRPKSKVAAMTAWAWMLAGYWWYTGANGLTPAQTMQTLINFVSDSPYFLRNEWPQPPEFARCR
jgi:hypothetical protein